MKKIISLLACVCLLLSVIVIPASAAEASATITFDDSSKATWSSEQQLWQENGITVTNNKASSTTNIDTSKKYSNPARFYKGSDVIIEYTSAMNAIVVEANTAAYATTLKGLIAADKADVTASASTVTIVPKTETKKFEITSLGGQVRVNSISVYTGGAMPDQAGPTFDPTGKTPAEIVDAAYALKTGEELGVQVTLTGVITKVDNAYNSVYKNVTVTMTVNGADANKPIMCYGLKGEGVDVIKVTDTITVTGYIKNYQGTIEFDKDCNLDSYIEGDGVVETPGNNTQIGLIENPVAGTAYKFGMNQTSAGKLVFATGAMSGYYMETTEDANAAVDVYLEETDGGFYIYAMVDGAKKYMNIQLNDAGTHVNAVYRDTPDMVFVYDAEKKTMVTSKTIVKGDKKDNYAFGTYGTYTTIGASATSNEDNFWCGFYGEGGTVVETPEKEEITAEAVANPVAGTAYKYALIQENVGKVLYVNGEMNGYYMATTENVDEAVDVYLEETDGGYYIYAMVDGAKKYMNIELSADGAHVNVVYRDTADKVFEFDTTMKTMVTATTITKGDTEEKYAFGTYNNYQTVSASAISRDNFWCKFYTGAVTTAPSTDDKKEDTTTNDTNNGDGEKLTFGVVEQPEAGVAYKFGMYQANLKKTLYITGEMNGFYMATTDDASKAADVYLEQTTGGYYIYALVNGAKKYLGITEAEGTDGKSHINAVFTDKPASVFTYNATLKTYVTKVGDREFTFGTRNDKNYDTVSPSETKYTENFVCQFYGMTKGGTSPATGDAVGSVIAMTMAIAAVMVYTSKKR